jgi:putative oxidoreductase
MMRIVVALLYLQYGLMKVFGFPGPGPASLSPLLMLAAAIETFGSLLLLIGLFTEAAAFILSGETGSRLLLKTYEGELLPVWQSGSSLTVLFCFVFLYLVFAGGGPWSLDSVRKRR